MYVLINEDGHNQVRVVPQGCTVVQHLSEALVGGYLMRSQPQRFPTRTRDWMSHDVKRRPDARYWRCSVRKQAHTYEFTGLLPAKTRTDGIGPANAQAPTMIQLLRRSNPEFMISYGF